MLFLSRLLSPSAFSQSEETDHFMRRMDLVFHSRVGRSDVERMARIAREIGLDRYADGSETARSATPEKEKVEAADSESKV
jgi:hypothetical protein